MSHHYSKLKWSLFVVISLLYRFDTVIGKQPMHSVDTRRQHSRHNNCHDYHRVNHRVNHVDTEANVRRKRRRVFFISGDNCNVRRKKKVITSTAAFVSSNHQLYSKQSISKISTNPPLRTPVITTTSKRTSTTTSLHLKFKTFEEMLLHHHTTPLLIDFYAPWCGPCKLMKGEISSIRDELDLLGPIVGVDENGEDGETEGEEGIEEEEDCSVEDVIALSSVCLEDGYIEEQQQQQNDGSSSSPSSDDDTQKLLEDLLTSIKAPPAVTAPPSTTTTTTTTTVEATATPNQEQTSSQTTNKKKQSPHRRGTPSGIPVYHVNTNKFPQVGAKNHIAGLPTLVLFYEGQELWRNEGFITGKEVVTVLKELQDGGWKRKLEEKKMEVVKTVEREDDVGSVNNKKEEEESSVNNKIEEKKAEVVETVVATGEEVVKKKKRKGRRLGG